MSSPETTLPRKLIYANDGRALGNIYFGDVISAAIFAGKELR